MSRVEGKADENLLPPEEMAALITIELVLVDTNKCEEREKIHGLNVDLDKNGKIIIDSIINQLKQRGYSLEGAKIFYYSQQFEQYICCSTDPIPRSYALSIEEKDERDVFHIKAIMAAPRDADDKDETDLIEEQKEELDGDNEKEENKEDEAGKDKGKGKGKNKRVKERKLAVIIEKVKRWRDLYYGRVSSQGKQERYSLELAAKKVHLPKKTLDDYLQQLKMGKQYGFDFNKYKDEKIGKLREFNKHQKSLRESQRTAPPPSET